MYVDIHNCVCVCLSGLNVNEKTRRGLTEWTFLRLNIKTLKNTKTNKFIRIGITATSITFTSLAQITTSFITFTTWILAIIRMHV